MRKKEVVVEVEEKKVVVAEPAVDECVMLFKGLLSDHKIYEQSLQALHWLTKGSSSFVLHELFGDMYEAQVDLSDEIAERILALGETPPHCYDCFLEHSDLEPAMKISDGKEGVKWAYDALEYLKGCENELIEVLEKKADAERAAGTFKSSYVYGSIDLLSKILVGQEKMCWQLKAFLS